MLLIGILTKKSSLNWIMRLHLVLIVEVKWRNMTFKNRLRFLTLKRLVCLLESSLENAVLSAISALKWWSLKPLSSRKITKYLVSSTKRLLKSWLKKLLWLTLPISCLFQLQLLFASSMTSGLSMIFLAFLRLCLGMNMPSPRERWALLRKILKSSLSSLFLKVEHKLSSEITFFDRAVRCQVKIITIDMFSPYYNLAKQIHFRISRFRLKQSPRLFHSRILKSF